MKIIVSLFVVGVVIAAITVSFNFGYEQGFSVGSSNGYSKGQVDLALEITKEIGVKVNNNTSEDSYTHFKDINDITLYIYKKSDVKTLAIWD